MYKDCIFHRHRYHRSQNRHRLQKHTLQRRSAVHPPKTKYDNDVESVKQGSGTTCELNARLRKPSPRFGLSFEVCQFVSLTGVQLADTPASRDGTQCQSIVTPSAVQRKAIQGDATLHGHSRVTSVQSGEMAPAPRAFEVLG